MITKMSREAEQQLYSYFMKNHADVPYCFPVDEHAWHESMFHDCDFDGHPLFAELKTLLLVNDGRIEGFIQFGLTGFVFDSNGEKDFSNNYAVIRNLHHLPSARNAQALLDAASSYFESKGFVERHAFFHYFGMSCYARQGKLHSSNFHIEGLLKEHGYGKEHENVYYSKDLQQGGCCDSPEMNFLSFSIADKGQTIEFFRGDEKVGGCELNLDFHADICYLKWIYIDEKYAHQGLGTICMYKLFGHLRQKGFKRMDTDTADSNLHAQGYYAKVGFDNKGRMRSYHIL